MALPIPRKNDPFALVTLNNCTISQLSTDEVWELQRHQVGIK